MFCSKTLPNIKMQTVEACTALIRKASSSPRQLVDGIFAREIFDKLLL